MCIFQSEQVIKLRFWLENNLADILVARSQSVGLSYEVQYWDATYAKTNQRCWAEDCLASIWNICKKTYQFKIHCKDDVMISLH